MKDRRFALMFYVLLLSMAVVPMVAQLRERPIVIEAAFGLILLSGMLGPQRPRTIAGAGVLLAAAITLRTLSQLTPHVALDVLAGVAFLGIGAVITNLVANFALKAKRVDAEHLYAALSVYLLLGLMFSAVYLTLELLAPGALSRAATPLSTEDAVYFSFVTLATLGYGDIVPVTAVARGIAIIEAIVGQFYIAVMVARMVTLYSVGAADRDQNASSSPK